MTMAARGSLMFVAVLTAVGCSSPAAKFNQDELGIVCSMSGDTCAGGENCCPGLVCNDGSTCGCVRNAQSCGAAALCCDGTTCKDGACCADQAQACTGNSDCCSGLGCESGACTCHNESEVCGAGLAPCCSGTSCDGTGHCRAMCATSVGACQPFGASCTADSECCKGGTCNAGKCSDPAAVATCGLEGATCATGNDCCGDATLKSKLDCVLATDGGHVCHLGLVGEPCDSQRHCDPLLTCIYPPPPPPPDAGPGVDAGDDAGIDDGGDDAGIDDGGVDSGVPDAGGPDAGPVDAGEPVGTCTAPSTNHTCNLSSSTCSVGDPCNPNSSANQGYDPCYYRVQSNQLAYRNVEHICHGGICTDPYQGEPCSGACVQSVGDSRKTSCLSFFDGSKTCMPECSTSSDCRGSEYYDNYLYYPNTVTNYCVNVGTKSGCQPELCFIEGQAGFDDPAVLYKPCMNHPDSLCLPRYVGSVSTILGFCEATRPDAGTSTVGQACDPTAGNESNAGLCGPDATCMGGRCVKLCDASQLGGAGTPSCPSDLTCISQQGLDLIADYQQGGCGDPCDPFADEGHNGCANYCGGPKARCEWLIQDPKPGLPHGMCTAALENPLAVGASCKRFAGIDPCVAGARCLTSGADGSQTCTKLCDPSPDAGPADGCPNGQTCNGFNGLTRSGYCQ